MGIPENHPAIIQAIEKGLIQLAAQAAEPEPDPVPKEPRGKTPRGASAFVVPALWFFAVDTRSEVNGREWRGRSARTQEARKAVSELMGRTLGWVAPYAAHYHAGGALRVKFTRLGRQRLDRSNLPTATKAVEDAVCLVLGTNDGDPRWRAEWEQDTSSVAGVRVELFVIPNQE